MSPTSEGSNRNPQDSVLHGVNPSSVIEAIQKRHHRRQKGDFSSDGRKIALVLEGGGMRASAPAGGAVALGHLGFSEVFDDVYATSAGVMNASYFMSEQEDIGITIYFDDLASSRFCNHYRFWKILDIDYVINEVVKRKKLLDISKIINSSTRLHIALMDRATGEGFALQTCLASEPLDQLLHAALSIPVFYNRTVKIDGRKCMDGGLSIPFPVKQAIEDGCSDILVLLSHPRNYEPVEPKLWQKAMFQLLCAQGRQYTFAAYANSHQASREARDIALGRISCDPGTNIATLCTDSPPFLHTMTRKREDLVAAATAYGKNTLSVFGVDPSGWELGPASALR